MRSFVLWILLIAGVVSGGWAFVGSSRAEKIDERAIASSADWPWWRGPQRNGVAAANQQPPTEWSSTKNVLWKSLVPGRGHGSPTVVGNQIFLATADEKQDIQSVLCYDRQTGKQLWQTVIHRGGSMRQNEKSTAASSTIACDGKLIFINFANSGAVYTTALSLDGKQRWQTKVSDYVIHQGYASSPAVYESLLIVSSDNKGGGAIAGLDRQTGKVVWKRDRPKTPNYTSPIILNVGGRDQLLLTGCDLFSSFNPLTGETLWEIPGATTECVTSTVTDGKHVYSSGGYPRNHTAAVLADGSGKIVWESTNRVYVPSLLALDGHLYAVLDAGVAACWESDTGKELWKQRLGGTFSASPVLVGTTIYATNEGGETFVYKASPKEYEQVAVNKLADEVFATPTICGGKIYMRVAQQIDGQRQELLYCLANPKP